MCAKLDGSIAFMQSFQTTQPKMLLHACCGPCSLEPLRLLKEEGITPTIHYANANIAPAREYEHRLQTIKDWAHAEGIDLVEGEYEPDAWQESVGVIGEALPGSKLHEERCRACYRFRFHQSARYAAEHGYDLLGTTLSVSPYQYTDLIEEELERACEAYGITPHFVDYSPFYANATKRSRDLGMYRQNYCGCAFSKAEAEEERAERLRERLALKEERARVREAEEAQARKRHEERARYDAKRAKQRAILKALRDEKRAAPLNDSNDTGARGANE